MSKDFDNLVDEAIENIRNDRTQTHDLLKDLINYIAGDDHRPKEVGLTAAKYVETLQRSNEQLVKIASLKSKEAKQNMNLSDADRDAIFSQLNGEEDGD